MLNGLKSGGVRERLTLDDPNVYKVTATMRHFALVLDVTKDEVHYFADGELVGTISGKGSKWEGWMKEVDCQEITAESYVGFAGRAVSRSDDVRLYPIFYRSNGEDCNCSDCHWV